MTHHTTSSGKQIAIAEMNEWHLHNAIKKTRHLAEHDPAHREHLAALEAEQARRGGPPKPKEEG